MNKVILMGRLTKDPEVRYTQGERSMAVARYTLAVDRRSVRKNENEQAADFISCTAFGRDAEFAEKYLHKGSKILVSGRIQTGSYTNRDGQKVYTTDVVVEEQEFAESKAAAGGSGSPYGSNSYASYDASSTYRGRSQGQQSPQSGFMPIPDGNEDEGLPFV